MCAVIINTRNISEVFSYNTQRLLTRAMHKVFLFTLFLHYFALCLKTVKLKTVHLKKKHMLLEDCAINAWLYILNGQLFLTVTRAPSCGTGRFYWTEPSGPYNEDYILTLVALNIAHTEQMTSLSLWY